MPPFRKGKKRSISEVLDLRDSLRCQPFQVDVLPAMTGGGSAPGDRKHKKEGLSVGINDFRAPDDCSQVGPANVQPVEEGIVNTLLVAEKEAEATTHAIKRKTAKVTNMDFQSRTLPAQIRMEPNDPEDVKVAKRKKIQAFKSNLRFEQLEVTQNKRQNALQQFQTTKDRAKKLPCAKISVSNSASACFPTPAATLIPQQPEPRINNFNTLQDMLNMHFFGGSQTTCLDNKFTATAETTSSTNSRKNHHRSQGIVIRDTTQQHTLASVEHVKGKGKSIMVEHPTSKMLPSVTVAPKRIFHRTASLKEPAGTSYSTQQPIFPSEAVINNEDMGTLPPRKRKMRITETPRATNVSDPRLLKNKGDHQFEPVTIPRMDVLSPSQILIPPEVEEEVLIDSIKEIRKDGPIPSGVSLREHTTPPDGRIYSIRFDSIGKPVGPNAGKFSARCGIYARMGHLFPLDVMWKKQLSASKALALAELSRMFQCIFDLDFSYCALTTIRDRLREWRYRMKRDYYEPYDTDEERIANRHPRVEEGQWKRLIILWSTEAKMVESERNKLNKAKQEIRHTLGRQSFSVLRDNMASSSGGDVLFSLAFVMGHQKASGGYHNKATKDLMERVMMSISQPTSSSSTSIDKSSSDISRLQEIICEVTGKEDHGGYCRGLGSGVRKCRLSHPMGTFQTLVQSSINQMRVDVERFKEDAKHAREEAESERVKRHAAEASAQAANARVEALEKAQYSTQQMFHDLQQQFNEFQKRN